MSAEGMMIYCGALRARSFRYGYNCLGKVLQLIRGVKELCEKFSPGLPCLTGRHHYLLCIVLYKSPPISKVIGIGGQLKNSA
jgi:hypothetical protein